jgi:lipoate---protein ligase
VGSGLSAAWVFEERTGPASTLFDAASWVGVVDPTICVLIVSAPTIVLGSSQSFEVVDLDACAAAGVEVVRRRSGGGAVWLDDDMLWVDVFVPSSHPRFDPDIGRATWWLGQAWADALTSCGVDGAVVHRGSMIRTAWSSLVCFAGLGAGEVTIDGRKVVGISQRRSRVGALFQCGIVRRWNSSPLVELLRLKNNNSRNDVAAAVTTVGFGVGPAADAAVNVVVNRLRDQGR